MVYIVMGVSGSGKTTIGAKLAKELNVPFYDADDFHSPANISKMARNTPLEDDDRIPWLTGLAGRIQEWVRTTGAVLACSALKEHYRRILGSNGCAHVVFIYLNTERRIIRERLLARKGHFFPVSLIDSQFDALEVPAAAVTVSGNEPPDAVCREILLQLSKRGLASSSEFPKHGALHG